MIIFGSYWQVEKDSNALQHALFECTLLLNFQSISSTKNRFEALIGLFCLCSSCVIKYKFNVVFGPILGVSFEIVMILVLEN